MLSGMQTERSRGASIARNAALGALILGGVGFLSGFLGPIALSPDANQGPLLGIFITGPGGALLGVLVGAVTGALRVSPRTFRTVLACAGTLLALTTLFFSTPEPEYRAGILDAEILDCSPPSSRRDKAVAYWEEALTRTNHYFTPRATWKQELDRMLATEPAVVLRASRAPPLRRVREPQALEPGNPRGASVEGEGPQADRLRDICGRIVRVVPHGDAMRSSSRRARPRRNGRRRSSRISSTCRRWSRFRRDTRA